MLVLTNECLWCDGAGNPTVQEYGVDEESPFYIQCQNCSSGGPYARTEQKAIELWLKVHGPLNDEYERGYWAREAEESGDV